MKGKINKNKIDYVIFHLRHAICFDNELLKFFCYNTNLESLSGPKVIFKLSEWAYDSTRVKWIDDIPVLFPIGHHDRFYYWEGESLVFEHDLIKSSFYLLSGYQEYEYKGEYDQLGRFPFKESIQNHLKINTIPVVNYYFEAIITGLIDFCDRQGIKCKKVREFENFAFMLTHDVDFIDSYDIYFTVYRLKQLLGLSPRIYDKVHSARLALTSILNFANPFSRKNHFWTFDYMLKVEEKYGIKAVYYFLHNTYDHNNSRYDFKEKRILKLFESLKKARHEIGLHGTTGSMSNANELRLHLNSLRQNARCDIGGIRQHTLKYRVPQTSMLHNELNLRYDSSLYFADCEGFRNSYCLPFKLYDFEGDQMIYTWQLPLNLMEVTFLGYKKGNNQDMTDSIDQLLNETKRFAGVFTLLWHNNYLSEVEKPGITTLYEEVIAAIMNRFPEAITGLEICDRMDALSFNNV